MGFNDLEFIRKMADLGTIKRVITKTNGELENDADHTCMIIFHIFMLDHLIPKSVPRLKLIQMALAHDAIEIYAGDTNYLDSDREGKRTRELEAANKIFAGQPTWRALWDEYEERKTETAITLKYLDIIQAVTSLMVNEGLDWKARGTTEEIERAFGDIHFTEDCPLRDYIQTLYARASALGYFANQERISNDV